MTAIHDRIIDHPSAWTGASLGGKEALAVQLDEEQLGVLDDLLRRTSHLPPQSVTRADFDHPALDRLLRGVKAEILHGRGAIVLRGLSPERYGEEQFQRIYWGFGTHLGIAAVQSALGDRLGYVQNKADDPVNRGYRGTSELSMHTDSYEIVGLMSVRKALSGGVSSLVSSLAIHNEILRQRPDLLPPLYRGYFYASEEARSSAKPITDTMIPVFSCKDGLVSCIVSVNQMKVAAVLRGEPLPGDLAEALDFFNATAVREDLASSFMLEPGEILLWHNYTNLHSRSAFTDDPSRRRLLLRLWLTVPDGRPAHPAVRTRAETYERIYRDVLETV